mmetsp:Transcript_9945/g.60788  ORF Transcript_9945/g.60788 Transcript_9945/m.60788 type:complete len:182 (-) Transcript_9945:2981-3526(-)
MVAYIESKVDDGDEDEEDTEFSNPFQNNVRKVQAIRGLRMALFGIPVVVEYLQRKKMGVEDVFHVKAVHSLAVVLLELPAGYISDSSAGSRPLSQAAPAVCCTGQQWEQGTPNDISKQHSYCSECQTLCSLERMLQCFTKASKNVGIKEGPCTENLKRCSLRKQRKQWHPFLEDMLHRMCP